MKPAQFDYVRAEGIDHALEALSRAGGDGKILAGGQSLIPMMNFRLARPSVLIDINRIPNLDRIEARDDRLSLGALVRHRMTAEDPLVARRFPILREAMKHVAHLTVRNRGTFCGSVCHADPAAEMPMMTMLLNGIAHIASVRGKRSLPASAFFLGSLATALEPDELVTHIELETLPPGTGWGFEEFARRHGDYALAAVAVTLRRSEGRARDLRMAVMGVADAPMRMSAAEELLNGQEFSDKILDEAIDLMKGIIAPNSDLHASADYRRHLAGVLARRAVRDAWARAEDAAA